MNEAFNTYKAFIASIDNAVAGTDRFGNLACHVDCSALANACDMQAEGTAERTEAGLYVAALETAKCCLDDWQSMYPQLVKD